ncbi:MAG: putative ABC transporter permease [Clostridia bacterium]|nr:putative ABC transporter permease [Clostridia bacterium]
METKKPFTILGLTVWQIMTYFLVYSVIGYIIETLFGLFTLGVIESRQSFLYGPFCGIYGVGATFMIVGMQKFPKTNFWLFIGGFVLGSVTEYLISFISEKFAGITWWDYSYLPLNINGRVCLLYSIFWGVLAIYLMKYFNPRLDSCIDWVKIRIPENTFNAIILAVFIFVFVEFIATAFAIQAFLVRIEEENNLNVPNKEARVELYEKIYGNERLANFIYKFWGDKKMIKTFPNLKIEDSEGNTIFINELLPNIKPYYFKFGREEIKESE